MISRKLLVIGILAILVVAATANFAMGNEPKETKGVFAFVGGMIGSGTFDLDKSQYHSEWKTKSSYSTGIFLNLPVKNKLFASVAIDIHNIKLSVYETEDSSPQLKQDMIEASVGLKLKLPSGNGKFVFWPGLAIGGAALKDIGQIDDSKYLTAKATADLFYMLGRRFGLVGQLGAVWAPLGGNGIYDVTGGPVLLLRGGITF